MPSLIELVEKINAGDSIDAEELLAYQESANSAERFLAHHAGATLQLRACHSHLQEALKAINYSDRRVLEQYLGLCGFLGHEELKPSPTLLFGRSAIERGEAALGMEAVSQAIAGDLARGGAWSGDRENGIELARICAQAAQAIAWTPAAGAWTNTQTRIAYIVSSLADEEPSARAAAAFAKSINHKQFRVGIYSTEAFCRREKQQFAGGDFAHAGPSQKRGPATLARIKEAKATHWIAPTTGATGGDMASAAAALADQLVNDQTDVLIIDADPADAIAGVLAHWKTARVKVWIARNVPLFSTSLAGVIYLDADRLESDGQWWRQHGITATSMLEGVDLDAPTLEGPRRSAYGIPESAVILTTATDEHEALSSQFVQTVAEVLRRHPQAVYLLIGPTETTAIRRQFESAGVGKRVGFAGRRKDLPGFLRVADVYLAEFPTASVTGLLQGMTMSLPAVAMAAGHDAETAGAAAHIVGGEATVAPGETEGYVERVARLIRDPAQRQQQGKAARQRIEQLYRYEQTARSIECICEQLIAAAPPARPAAPDTQVTFSERAARKAA